MYKEVTFEELKHCSPDFKLCYIDSIPLTILDYSEESKKRMGTKEYKDWRKERDDYIEQILKERGSVNYNNDLPSIPYEFQINYEEQPNPDYVEGEKEYYAFFTNLNFIHDQWGDDWDDTPYEYNAEIPYDDRRGVEHTILKVPFYVNHDGFYVKFPSDYQCMGNSHFCVRDINAGAVAWIFAKGQRGKSSLGAVSVQAGFSPLEFYLAVKEINELYPFTKKEEDDG